MERLFVLVSGLNCLNVLCVVYVFTYNNTMTMWTKTMIPILAAGMLAGCGSTYQSPLEGDWVQPVPGQPKAQQGVRLEKGGKASSINMATLVYESWEVDGNNNLKLKGKSVGNKQTIPFEETVLIKEITPTNMTLSANGQDVKFTRQP